MITFFFFFNDTATTEIYTLSLHDALPICMVFAIQSAVNMARFGAEAYVGPLAALAILRELGPVLTAILVGGKVASGDRKSTRLNSSHLVISYAVFCLQKKRTA